MDHHLLIYPNVNHQKEEFESIFGATVSASQYLQLSQERIRGKMHHFDFENAEMNQQCYGQPEPPEYDLARIKLETITIIHGRDDLDTPPKEIGRLANDLQGEFDCS